MSEFRTVPVTAGTTLRRGGSTKGDVDASNVIGVLPKNDYRALVQCPGQDVEDQHHHKNYWWVLVETPLGRGWVSAVRISEGGDNQPIDKVTKAVTVYDVPGTAAPTTVHVVSTGAPMYPGGSTRSQPHYPPTQIPAGAYSAYWQCGGEDVTVGDQHNFRWVLLTTPYGQGWVSAVHLKEGPNGGPIPQVGKAPTVFSTPPDLLP